MKYYHGLYDVKNLYSIIKEGLRSGSSVSDVRGQASAYPIILEFDMPSMQEVSYRPGDYKFTGEVKTFPKAVYVDTEELGLGIMSVDDINKALSTRIGELEVEGWDGDWDKVFAMGPSKFDKKLGKLLKELDEAMDAEIKFGKGASKPSGEEIFSEIKANVKLPIKRVVRNEEGDIDWGQTEGESSPISVEVSDDIGPNPFIRFGSSQPYGKREGFPGITRT